ncbi:LacI family DNA-binding transcriptional regulator [Nonomuraea phyllanthi]|uniref:LacI family DNA-binding transcriptional regulator n=1 Tax=Nonomuraea phyllanthi TaxID=2219224 RepID=UPI001293ECF6|nr:LacI family DNA-binding transcriptional regulator [Nonomuraea phyllanthi]QFY07738.1 LacI family DNA-binding transcriptional regulator [Nonomuraea phyllanthi]
MRVTMRDVARHAGVSVKTVSRVVNREPHTRPEVIRRVHASIDALGWVPNGSARALRTGRTGIVGIGVAELRRPYLAGLVEALVTEADRRGMQAAVEPTHRAPESLRRLLDARGRVFDGVVLIGDDLPGSVSGALDERPVVVVHGARPHDEADRVDEDVAEAATLTARHLAVMGRTRPALLGADRGGVGESPAAALLAALAATGIDPGAVPVVALGPLADRRAGARAGAEILARRPEVDVLLCVNDEVALGALAALAARGIDVPGRVAVIGHDNLEDGWFSTPSLTTIDPGRERIARAAFELLGARLDGTAPARARSAVLPVRLVRRESTLGVGAG